MTQQPDTATARDMGGGFDPHPEGQFAMTCVDVVNLGTKVERFGDQDPREVEKASLVFASGESQDKGELMIVTVEMTLSMNEKANMRKFLESWRGKSYTAEQAEAGVPLHKLHGQTALVTIEHVTTRRNRRFAKVVSISPLPKQVAAPNGETVASYTRPAFFAERKKEYATLLATYRGETNGGYDGMPEAIQEDDDSDLPF